MSAASLPFPQDADAFLGFLMSLEMDGPRLDTFQLTAATVLLSAAQASGPGSHEREAFWSQVLPVLATSARSRLHLERAASLWLGRQPAQATTTSAPTPPPPVVAASASPRRRQIRPWVVLAIAWGLAQAGGVTLVNLVNVHRTSAPTIRATTPPAPRPSASAAAPAEFSAYDLVSESRPAVTQHPQRLRAVRSAILMIPMVLLLAWAAWLLHRRRTLLSQQPSDEATPDKRFLEPLDESFADMVRRTDLRSIAQKLRPPVIVPTHEIDVARSVRDTVRRAGSFRSVRRRRRQQPEYLAMIERRSAGDHMAMLYGLIAERLKSEGLNVRTLHYHDDPRLVVESTPSGPRIATIESLAADAVGQRVLVMGPIDAFIEPFSGDPWAWVSQFDPWTTRAVLDPRARARDAEGEVTWGPADLRLGEAGWLIGTGRRSGFESFGDRLSRRRNSPLLEGRPARPAQRNMPLRSERVSPSTDVQPRATTAAGEPGAVPVLVLEHGVEVTDALFHPGPEVDRVLTTTANAVCRIWDSRTGDAHREKTGAAQAVFWRDGACLSIDRRRGSLVTWRIDGGGGDDQVMVRHGQARFLAATPDGLTLALAVPGGVKVYVSDPEGSTLKLIKFAWLGSISFLALSAKAERMAAADPNGALRLYALPGCRSLKPLEGRPTGIRSAAFATDGRRLVAASEDGKARIWEGSTGKSLMVLEGHKGPVNTAVFAPDDRRLLTASDDGSARVWDVATGRMLLGLEGHRGRVVSAAFSPSGLRVVTASVDRTARLWDISDVA